jgi:RNA polymerase primary sigma factor
VADLTINRRITNRTLNIYLREIGKVDPLTEEEEKSLPALIRKGDTKALERFTSANLKFVVKIAKEYQRRGLSLVDLVNEGNVGLLKAARRFDEKKGVKFISYAVWWIRQCILKALSEQTKIVRLPLSQEGRIRKIASASSGLMQEKGREPSVEEIANKLKLDPHDVMNALRLAQREISLDAPLSEGDDEREKLVDFIASKAYPSPEEQLKWDTFCNEIREILAQLSCREARVLSLYYGIGEEGPLTLEKIGEVLGGLSRERVRQIKEQALRKLRNLPNHEHLKAYLS